MREIDPMKPSWRVNQLNCDFLSDIETICLHINAIRPYKWWWKVGWVGMENQQFVRVLKGD